MSSKGIQTKESIRQTAYELFAEKGFTAVTMKDVCEACGLSRGGLYRHYSSTRQIFEEILAELSDSDFDFIQDSIGKGVPADVILEHILTNMQQEMQEDDRTLSYAIYEYSRVCDNSYLAALNRKAVEKWRLLLTYGISRGEFAMVEPGQMTDIILYVYQGVRMWSRVLPIPAQTVENIIDKIQSDLTGKPDPKKTGERKRG